MSESLPKAGRLISSEIKNQFKNKMQELISDIGRAITLHLSPTIEDCPNCGFNDITKRSNRKYDNTNPNTLNGPKNKVFLDGQVCPVCNDQGVLKTPRSTQWTATISKKFTEEEILEAGIGRTDKHLIKTLTIVDSYAEIVECAAATIDGEIFKKVGKSIKTGLQNLIHVRQFWERAE